MATPMIIDGRALAHEVLAQVKARATKLMRTPRVLVIVTNKTLATKSYLSIKKKRATNAGCTLEVLRFSEHTSMAALHAAVRSADADALIVQLPLSASIDTKAICDAIPLEKDADILSTLSRMQFEADEPNTLIPPVASAVAKILTFGNVNPKGKKTIVIGAGWLVGNPCATWLSHMGADVSHLTLESGDTSLLHDADIIISGAGSPHLIKPKMIKEGVVLIDAGTAELGGEIIGDADPACAGKCSLFTPVPGGVGPISVACLFENVVTLTERAIYN